MNMLSPDRRFRGKESAGCDNVSVDVYRGIHLTLYILHSLIMTLHKSATLKNEKYKYDFVDSALLTL